MRACTHGVSTRPGQMQLTRTCDVGVVEGHALGHADDRELGRAVSEAVADGDDAADRGEVDDRPARAAIIDGRKARLHEHGAADVDGVEAVEIVGGRGEDCADVADAGVVDEDVAPIVVHQHAQGDFFASGFVGDVDVDELGVLAAGA